jgi:hypothetical protein
VAIILGFMGLTIFHAFILGGFYGLAGCAIGFM